MNAVLSAAAVIALVAMAALFWSAVTEEGASFREKAALVLIISGVIVWQLNS